MRNYRFTLWIVFIIALLLVSTQAFASPANLPPTQNTPGANATQKAIDKATQQAGKPPRGKREHFKGIVTVANANSITLTLRDNSSVTVGLNSDTWVKFPGPPNSAPTSIQAGMTVTIQAIRDQTNNLIALRVMALPSKPTKVHRVGIVTAYSPGQSITIQDKKGNSSTFTLSADLKLLPPGRAGSLAVGSLVTVIAPRDPANGVNTAKGIVVHPAKP